jgi:IS5 family transposase
MNHEDRIIWLYLRLEAAYREATGGKRLRKAGFDPGLSDVEVLTMEIFGEWQGHHGDKAIWRYFDQHWRGWFPRLTDYKTFTKQCANLRWMKERLLGHLWPKGDAHIIDGVPLPLCQFARARRCRRLRDLSAYGHCAAKKMTYWGLKGFPLMRLDGPIVAFWTQSANENERLVLDNTIGFIEGLLLADKGFQDQNRATELQAHGIDLLVPARKNMTATCSQESQNILKNTRRRIETAIGQLVERFGFQNIKARSPLAFFNAIFRKILAYNFSIMIKS